jgi:hypothetical protein
MTISEEQQILEIAPVTQMLDCAIHYIWSEYYVIQSACALEFKLEDSTRRLVITFVYSLFNSVFHSLSINTVMRDRIAE